MEIFTLVLSLILTLTLPVLVIAFLPICFVFKKTQVTKWRVLAISFFIPFINLVWYLIEGYCCPDVYPHLSEVSGALWLFLFLPILFFISLCIPQKIFKVKKQTLLTIFLTGVFGWLLIVSIIPIALIRNAIFPEPRSSYYNPLTIQKLKSYNPAIKYIGDYKQTNGTYPKNIDKIEIKSNDYPFFKYSTYNKGKDFVLFVNEREITHDDAVYGFRYCSNENLPNCKAIGYENGNGYLKIGDWIHIFYYD